MSMTDEQRRVAAAALVEAERTREWCDPITSTHPDADFEAAIAADLVAIRHFQQALALAPDNAVYQYHLGTALFRQNRREEARQQLSAALKGTLDKNDRAQAEKMLDKLLTDGALAQAGDGSTADIGFQCISGMFERGHNVLYVCYDNEAYMNTGVQRSSFTPYGAWTSTTPMGNPTRKKNLPLIAADHGIPYVATATVDDFRDLQRKVKNALSIEGPKYIHILAPCPLGWGHPGELTVKICRLAKDTGLFPIFEIIDGKVTNVKKIPVKVPVEEYLKLQGRFRFLFKKGVPTEDVAVIQKIANQNIERFNL